MHQFATFKSVTIPKKIAIFSFGKKLSNLGICYKTRKNATKEKKMKLIPRSAG